MVSPRADRPIVGRGTTRRFLMLLFVTLAACMSMSYATTLTLWSAASQFCRLTRDDLLDTRATAWSPENLLSAMAQFAGCPLGSQTWAVRTAPILTGAVALAAVTLYLCLPVWKGRPGRLIPVALTPRLDPLPRHLYQLVLRARVPRLPVFAIDPRAMSASALVFGLMGNYTVCLHAGLLARRSKDPTMFEAVVLHELAHIRNRDVDITYLTVALWRVFLIAVLLPYLAVHWWLLLYSYVPDAPRFYWLDNSLDPRSIVPGVFAAVLVYLSRCEILRSRELCADLDACASGADPKVWRPRGAVDLRGRVRAGLRGAAQWWIALWRPHPTWAQRYRTLTRQRESENEGTGLQSLLFMGAMFPLLQAFEPLLAWPPWVWTSVVYVVAPLVFATGYASTPSKRPVEIDVWPALPPPLRFPGASRPPLTPTRRMPTPWRLLLVTAFVVALVVALFVVDPLNGRSG